MSGFFSERRLIYMEGSPERPTVNNSPEVDASGPALSERVDMLKQQYEVALERAKNLLKNATSKIAQQYRNYFEQSENYIRRLEESNSNKLSEYLLKYTEYWKTAVEVVAAQEPGLADALSDEASRYTVQFFAQRFRNSDDPQMRDFFERFATEYNTERERNNSSENPNLLAIRIRYGREAEQMLQDVSFSVAAAESRPAQTKPPPEAEQVSRPTLNYARVELAFLSGVNSLNKVGANALRKINEAAPNSPAEKLAYREYVNAQRSLHTRIRTIVEAGIRKYGDQARGTYNTLVRKYGHIETPPDLANSVGLNNRLDRLQQGA